MANRLVGNVVIVDSAMGNAFVLSSAGLPVQMLNMKVNAIEFWSSTTNGTCVFTGADTTNVVKRFDWMIVGTINGIFPPAQSTSFGDTQYFDNLKVPVLTAGTAWIYLA